MSKNISENPSIYIHIEGKQKSVILIDLFENDNDFAIVLEKFEKLLENLKNSKITEGYIKHWEREE